MLPLTWPLSAAREVSSASDNPCVPGRISGEQRVTPISLLVSLGLGENQTVLGQAEGRSQLMAAQEEAKKEAGMLAHQDPPRWGTGTPPPATYRA